ncbi:Na+/H+ antiporter NhaA [Rhodocytophaga aerolata]|uniref:Na(+)/H(+) antiporter NhaA n=1 Tax=Rhodocytophaga aerolata TaxID=455078 RepID=A0ABT8R1G1_9BACT|nr:Na+/H+ antiporter NhaA [Rhodocytophaga aerolata]MDO1445224.1 Na+/H+ antiporter NhaA [Rhodocytophaga aerolata]
MQRKTVRIIQKLRRPFIQFIQLEQSSGIILIGVTFLSLMLANSQYSEPFLALWEKHLSINFENFHFDHSLLHWINDGLMAIFFLLVGLEIKRELLEGELSSVRQAMFPIFAALGGMIVPAIIYSLFNLNTATSSGWGIPMATDIAFALAILSLLSNRVPVSLKIFLTALAIIDDLGAVIVIAVFYTADLSLPYLFKALLVFLGLLLLNRIKVKKLFIYVVLGILLWYFMYESGVHATVAGVLLALTIPYKTMLPKDKLVHMLQNKFSQIRKNVPSPETTSRMIMEEIEEVVEKTSSVSQKLEHTLHGYVLYLIMPIFALANTGLVLETESFSEVLSPGGIGIFLGLVLGKPLGICLFCWLAVKTNISSFPEYTTWQHIIGAGFLGGIGFTMSIFITLLAFQNADQQNMAKLAVLFASLTAASIGYIILRNSKATIPDEQLEEEEIM